MTGNREEQRVIGVIGGMGPLATADFYRKLIAHTDAARDQEHPHVIIDADTAIPDRTEALLRGGDDPAPALVASAKRLANAGAELLVMPCNTAHCFYQAITRAVYLPVLHMIALTRDALRARGIRTAGLLATDGAVGSGIYQETFAGSGVTLLLPDAAEQAAVTDIVYDGVKAGNLDRDIAAFRRACEALLARGAETLLLGCTELPPVFAHHRLAYPQIDPTLELALAALRAAGYPTK